MPSIPSSLFTTESILKMIETTCNLIDKSAVIINKYLYQPVPNSKASQEMSNFAEPGLVEDVHARARLCFENAADHLMAFTDTLKQPAKTLSPYTCLRSLLESSAIALWLLDLNIDARERVGRCFGYRYKEFEEQIKFFTSDRVDPVNAQKTIASIQQRIAVVEAKAISLGYPKLTSKNGKITGIAMHMPETVGIIKMMLDKETEYRLFSGIAHSYLWATRQVGFKVIDVTDPNGKKIKAFEKHANPEMILLGVNLAVPTFSRVVWVMGNMFGWEMQEIEDLLNHTFNKIGFNSNMRFWNQP